MTIFKFLSSIRKGLWFVLVVCVVAGVILSFGTIAIDRAFGFELIPDDLVGGPDAALAILSTVAAVDGVARRPGRGRCSRW